MSAASLAMLPWPAMGLAVPYGLVVGILYFLTLRYNTRLYLGQGPVWRPIALMFCRMMVTLGLLWVMLPWGWPVMLAGLVGFTVARRLVMVWSDRRTAWK